MGAIHSLRCESSSLMMRCLLFSLIFLLINPRMLKCMSSDPFLCTTTPFLYSSRIAFPNSQQMSPYSNLNSGGNSSDSIGLHGKNCTLVWVL